MVAPRSPSCYMQPRAGKCAGKLKSVLKCAEAACHKKARAVHEVDLEVLGPYVSLRMWWLLCAPGWKRDWRSQLAKCTGPLFTSFLMM